MLLIGCQQKMADAPEYRPLDPSDFFPDGASARPVVANTVARGQLQDDTLLTTGQVNGQDSTVFPYPVTKDILTRGQQRYDIYCVPCHGTTGDGNGTVVARGFSAPPTFHSDRLRQAPVGHFFVVISQGFGSMPDYANQIPVRDRWAIIAYIRALQRSQDAPMSDAPADVQQQLQGQAK